MSGIDFHSAHTVDDGVFDFIARQPKGTDANVTKTDTIATKKICHDHGNMGSPDRPTTIMGIINAVNESTEETIAIMAL